MRDRAVTMQASAEVWEGTAPLMLLGPQVSQCESCRWDPSNVFVSLFAPGQRGVRQCDAEVCA